MGPAEPLTFTQLIINRLQHFGLLFFCHQVLFVSVDKQHRVVLMQLHRGNRRWDKARCYSTVCTGQLSLPLALAILYLLAASAVCQLPSAVHTTPLPFDIQSSSLLCGWSNGLELVTWHCLWSDTFAWQFSAWFKNFSFLSPLAYTGFATVRYIHSRLTMTLSAMADQWQFASMLVHLPISTWSYVLWYQSETCTGQNFQAMTFWPDPMSFSLFVDSAHYSPLYFIAGLA